jgi:hypothetical protein
MITDNALIAFECLHTIRNGNKTCKEFRAYKLNLTKAYDEWIGVIWKVFSNGWAFIVNGYSGQWSV